MRNEDIVFCEEGLTSDSSAEPTPQKNENSSEHSTSKKRRVNKVIPVQSVKRDLSIALLHLERANRWEASEGLDDNSVSLLNNIYDYFNNESLKCLLDKNTQNILEKCRDVIKPGIMIVRKLFWNQAVWHRQEQLESFFKGSIFENESTKVIQCLLDNELLVPDTPEVTENYLSKLKQTDLYNICEKLKLKGKNKLKMILDYSQQRSLKAFLHKNDNSNNIQRVLDIIQETVGYHYKLSDQAKEALKKLYTLMYLGAPYLMISKGKLDSVLTNDKAEKITYPIDKNMTLDNASVVFKSQNEFENYLNSLLIQEKYLAQETELEKKAVLLEVYDRFKNICEEDMLSYQSLPVWLHKFTPPFLYVTILEDGVRILKKLEEYDLALEVLTTLTKQSTFSQDKKAEWYSDMGIIYENTKMPEKAAEVLLEALESDLPNKLKDDLRKRANKIADKHNTNIDEEIKTRLKAFASDQILENSFPSKHIIKKPLENTGNHRVLFEVQLEGSTVVLKAEEYCIYYYQKEGSFPNGGHWEGSLATTLFFLLFWDIIYTKPSNVSGIFMSYYQIYPLDIYDESFYNNRKEIIDQRLKDIENDKIENLIHAMQKILAERPLCEVSEMYRELKWVLVRDVATSLGAVRVAALCARVATRGLRARDGFPDLTLWNHATRQVRFVEVKTDSDRPSIKQLQWMDYLRKHDMDVEFCYVGIGTARCKARAATNIEQNP